ncbi:MAG TPA: AraC family transcriptional regulator [Candidatus Sulfotelmatobacter sp.]|nr:AraC family transcriptional regulator [Candidatus Sulfotelmatobacter sp.]
MIQARHFPRKPRHFSDLFEEYGSGSIARLPAHQNGGFEVHYIAKGHLHWEIEGRPFLVAPRSVFFTFPWEKHGSCVDFEPGHQFHFVVYRLADDVSNPADARLVEAFGLAETEQAGIFAVLSAAANRCFVASADFAWAMTRLTAELETPGILARMSVIALSQTVLCELVRSIRHAETQNPENSATQRRVHRFIEELRTRCSEPWTLDSMAAACRLKRTQFETLTKELTGDAPTVLLNRFRVRQSQASLKNNDKNITEVAFEAGFGSSQYFARVFRNMVGMTPSEYRRQRGNMAKYDRHFLKALERLKA